MTRAFLIVMDSVGCGGAPDAHAFFNDKTVPDTGANTLAHIAQACAEGRADVGRSGPLAMPHLDALGLGAAVRLASGDDTPGFDAVPNGLWGAAQEVSPGKDTPTGHWEIAGVPLPWDWGYFPDTVPTFPLDLTGAICAAAGVDGILGDKHASGTVILDELGDKHIRTGYPIVYTSADSVVQIAAHEEHFGLERLYTLCEAIAPMVHYMRVGRVIARPFVGTEAEGFTRTSNRRDFAMTPPEPTLCDWVTDAGGKVHAIGKIGDIFAHRGITTVQKGSDADLMEHLVASFDTAQDGDLVFANFVEFDAKYGHRRDIPGYTKALEWFDTQVPRLLAKIQPGDLVLFTADHGNDPSWVGTDHTRERVPVVAAGLGPREVGHVGFSDIGASVAAHLGLTTRGAGETFL
ncbi:phosphopentomutase [Aliiroseovarius halocynthiae]|uniref:Phosphopentomutase n=1 Tax=Aliiroseovarius halocynthiae TaxID=985055 RepID=A0A545SR79_9RHOB|nr:phosphopentomutase [Aliiroseovarius halocynthiae]TQV67459.1 phosphopentomutase [Aliiroseovarius halocynthiae]SMR81467.1 phosphopentomutase [Aliiroseovarius halocynthiae]